MRAVADGRGLWAVWDARALAEAVRADNWLNPMIVAGVMPICTNPVCVGAARPLVALVGLAALSMCGDWVAIPIRLAVFAKAGMQ